MARSVAGCGGTLCLDPALCDAHVLHPVRLSLDLDACLDAAAAAEGARAAIVGDGVRVLATATADRTNRKWF